MAIRHAMRLADYLNREKIRPSVFAKRIGVPASTITRLLKGERKPGLPLMSLISEATGHEVFAVEDFMFHESDAA